MSCELGTSQIEEQDYEKSHTSETSRVDGSIIKSLVNSVGRYVGSASLDTRQGLD